MSPRTGVETAPEALLLTGPLGAGKTTLIERSILPAFAGGRVVVLVNDAGAVPLDALLLGETRVPILGVSGGCFCCSAGGRLLEALAEIRDRLAPELLIVEGSGLTPPGPIAAGLQEEGYRFVGAIGVVAAGQLDRLPRDSLLRAQLAAAGLIVVTGADRLDRAGFEAARRALEGLARGPVLPAFEGRVRGPLASLLAPGLGAQPGGDGHLHAAVRTLRLEPRGLPRRSDLLAWLAAAPPVVLRVKGLVQCAEHLALSAVNHALGESDLRPLPASGEALGLWVVHEGEPPSAWLDALPAGLDPTDWAALDETLLPLGEADAREGSAFVEGRRVEPLAAAEAFLDRLAAADRPLFLTTPLAGERLTLRWSPAVARLRVLGEARLAAIDEALRGLEADLLFLAGLPDAVAERIARLRPELPTLHLARRFAVPTATVSLRIDGRLEGRLAEAAAAERAGRAQPSRSGSGQNVSSSAWSNEKGEIAGKVSSGSPVSAAAWARASS